MWQFDTVTDAFEFYYDRLDSQLEQVDTWYKSYYIIKYLL